MEVEDDDTHCSMHNSNSVPAIHLGNRLEPEATGRTAFQILPPGMLNPKHMQSVRSSWDLCQQVPLSPGDSPGILTWKVEGSRIPSCSGEDGFASKHQLLIYAEENVHFWARVNHTQLTKWCAWDSELPPHSGICENISFWIQLQSHRLGKARSGSGYLF